MQTFIKGKQPCLLISDKVNFKPKPKKPHKTMRDREGYYIMINSSILLRESNPKCTKQQSYNIGSKN